MRDVSCFRDGCRCHRTLFRRADNFKGSVEVKCPRCRRLHLFRFWQSPDVPVETRREVRCPNSFKGQDMGGWCGQLVMKLSDDATGTFAYRCPRCKDERTIRINQPAMMAST